MSRREHLQGYDSVRIRALANRGLSNPAIAKALGLSRQSVWRVRSGRRVLPPWREPAYPPENLNSGRLETASALRLETRIGLAGSPQESDMTTAEQVQINFVDALGPHFTMRRRYADRFVADLTAALIEERFSVSVLQRAAQTFIRTRSNSSFPSVAACLAACRAEQVEAAAGDVSTPGLNSASPPLTAVACDRAAVAAASSGQSKPASARLDTDSTPNPLARTA